MQQGKGLGQVPVNSKNVNNMWKAAPVKVLAEKNHLAE